MLICLQTLVHCNAIAPPRFAALDAICCIVLVTGLDSSPLGQQKAPFLLQEACNGCRDVERSLPHLAAKSGMLQYHRALDIVTKASVHTNCFTKVCVGSTHQCSMCRVGGLELHLMALPCAELPQELVRFRVSFCL
jgi:hypothetical protein